MIRTIFRTLALPLTLTLIFSSGAQAFPLLQSVPASLSLPQNFTANYNFEGIVALSNCSGSLIRFENSTDNDFAMVLTNGHCLETGMPKPGQFVYGQASSRQFKLFNSSNKIAGKLMATQVMYSTMTTTDMTIYKLSQSYAAIKKAYDVNAMTLSSQHPSLNDSLEVISGYWNRGYNCSIEAFVSQLKEAKWTMTDSIRYSRPGCEVIGGTSGSPIILAGSRTVIGVNNTGNMSGRECVMNNPCEVNNDGSILAKKGYSYGQQTYIVYSCLNQFNEIDLQVPGCLLPK